MKKWLTTNSTLLSSISSLIQIILFPLIFIGIVASYLQVNQYLQTPDLSLIFSNAKELIFTIKNNGKETAEQPLYGFGIFDHDSNPIDIIPILWKEISYVNSKATHGPNELMKRYGIIGHRYLGYAKILCKNCDTEKLYWIYFVHGSNENAWVTEIGRNEPRIWNWRALLNNPSEFIKINFPEHKRQPIK